ncbi:MAG: hypothetical protein NT069_34510 [Planctomycetota bacterium]|nr:hypothetical protein [Planctomycetota bacterium]
MLFRKKIFHAILITCQPENWLLADKIRPAPLCREFAGVQFGHFLGFRCGIPGTVENSVAIPRAASIETFWQSRAGRESGIFDRFLMRVARVECHIFYHAVYGN